MTAGPNGDSVAFVSHETDNDGGVAMAMCGALESRGLHCWISPRDIPPGIDWPAAIVQGINASGLLVLVLSAAANESRWVLREVMAADKRGLPIVPVRIEDVEPAEALEFVLGPAQWLNAFAPPVERHFGKLEQAVAASRHVEAHDAKPSELGRGTLASRHPGGGVHVRSEGLYDLGALAMSPGQDPEISSRDAATCRLFVSSTFGD